MTPWWTLLFIFLLSKAVSAQQRACYFPNGLIAIGDLPCSSNTTTTCCRDGDACLDNGLCLVGASPVGGLLRGSCTDQTWNSRSCPQYCVTDVPAGNNSISDVTVLDCGGTKGLCCETDTASACDCQTGNGTFHLSGVTSIITILPSSTTTSSSSKTSTTSSQTTTTSSSSVTPTPQSSTTTSSITGPTTSAPAPSKGPSKAAITGIGVGAPLVVLLFLVTVLIFFRRRKAQKKLIIEQKSISTSSSILDPDDPEFKAELPTFGNRTKSFYKPPQAQPKAEMETTSNAIEMPTEFNRRVGSYMKPPPQKHWVELRAEREPVEMRSERPTVELDGVAWL